MEKDAAKFIIACHKGFTLVELMITLAISGIVVTSIYSAYLAQQRSYTAQNQVTEMQQNQRAALDNMARNLRMAGYSPGETADVFRLLNIQSGVNFTMHDGSNIQFDSIQFSADLDEDDTLDGNETITYSLYDYPVGDPTASDGIPDLAINIGGGRQLVAESIDALGFAYAFDQNNDGEIDLSTNGNVIWAIDSDNDNDLDTELDTNDDGDIDINDTAGGAALAGAAPDISEIRAVRIWILARAKRADTSFYNSNTYVIADRRVTPNDNVRRRLVEYTLFFRNIM